MRSFFKVLMALGLLCTSSVSVAAVTKSELKSRKATLTSKGTHRRLSRAHSLLGKDKPKEALKVLERLLKSTEKRPHEKAQVLNTMAHAYAHMDKNKMAISYFQKALDLKTLPYNPTLTILFSIAQLNVAEEKYGLALKQIDNWFALADKPSPEAYVIKATILAQQKKRQEALKLVTKAIDMTDKPKESWLAFAVAMNYELNRYKEAARLLEKLAGLYPDKKKYWKQLAGVYLNLDNNQKALATLELADKGQYLEKTRVLCHR